MKFLMINFLKNDICMLSLKYKINFRVSKKNKSRESRSKEKQLKIKKDKLISKQIKNLHAKRIINKNNKDYVEQDFVYENHKPKLKKLYIYRSSPNSTNKLHRASWFSLTAPSVSSMKQCSHQKIIKNLQIQYKTESKRHNNSYRDILVNGQVTNFSKSLEFNDSHCLSMNESFSNIKYIFDDRLPTVLTIIIGDYYEYSYVHLLIRREATKLLNIKTTKPRCIIELRSMSVIYCDVGMNRPKIYVNIDKIKKIKLDGSIFDIKSSSIMLKNFYNLEEILGIKHNLNFKSEHEFEYFSGNCEYTTIFDVELQENIIYDSLYKVSKKHNLQQIMRAITNNSTWNCVILYFPEHVYILYNVCLHTMCNQIKNCAKFINELIIH